MRHASDSGLATHKRRNDRYLVLLRVLGTVFLSAATCTASAREIRIAVVKDGPGAQDRLASAVERELALHLPRDVSLRFEVDPGSETNWDPARVASALDRALADPQIDIVLALGSLGTGVVARSETELTKPVVCGFVQPADLFDLAYGAADSSTRTNLSIIAVAGRSVRDIRRFHDLVGFRSLTIAVGAGELQSLPEIGDKSAELQRRLGIELDLVGVGSDLERAISDLSDSEAVYVTRLERIDQTGRQRLFDALARHGIPSFSSRGHTDVRLGALAAQTPDFEEQVVRRLALNLSRLIRGEPAENLPVLMTVDTRLLINGMTAKAIGWSPDRETRIFAHFLHADALNLHAEMLDLRDAFQMADQNNSSLAVEDTAVEGARQDRLRARSRLLPQLGSRFSWTQAETDLVGPEDAATGELSLRQQIWDDAAHSNYRGSQRLLESSEQDREALRLDVLRDSGSAYYGLGLAQALYRIEADNLRLTEEFLELARLRREVGYSGREEILRWESAVADSRSRLFRSAEDVELTRIALNRVLGIDQERRWYPTEVEIDPERFSWLGGALDPFFDDLSYQERLRDEALGLAVENAPELRSLDRLIEAQQIEVGRLKRRYYVPNVFAEGGYSNQFTDPEPLIFPDEWSYSIGVVAEYPLIEGGRRKHDLARARADLEGVERQRDLVVELIEQRTRSAAQRVANSFPRIRFSRQAADAAGESLQLVREQYSEGTVNVTDLLDAQNQKFTADQAVTVATFEFLLDLIELERAIGWFEADNDPAARDALVERLRSAAVAP